MAVASRAVVGVEYVRVWPAAPATDADIPTSRKTAIAARFRPMPPTARTLSAIRAGRADDFRTHYPSADRLRRADEDQLPQGPILGFFGRLSENASEFPELAAVARSQSFFVAFRLSVAWKTPLAFDEMSATVRHFPVFPCRS